MSLRETILRQRMIINKIRKHPATFKEIEDYLSSESVLQSYNFTVSPRTFQRDLDDIRVIYNIDIQYDYSRKVYLIYSDDQLEANERIMEAFDLFHALNLKDRLSSYIHFEKRKPAGTENLYGLLHAIKNRLQVKFSYQKFWEDEITPRTAEPYALKEFKNRWYILAKDQRDGKIKTFGLERLSNLEITTFHCTSPNDINIEENFRYCYGIMCKENEEPQEVILSFDPTQGKYIKSLPLHESQQVLFENDNELQVKLTLFVTYDLVKELLSYGEYVKVLQPSSLVYKMKSELKTAYSQYK